MAHISIVIINAVLAFTSTLVSATPLSARRILSSAPAGPNKANWQTFGCTPDFYPNGRLFNGGYYEDKTGMTIGKCLAFCDKQNQAWAGLEYGYQCFCSNTAPYDITASPADLQHGSYGGCTTPAAGNSSQDAGGPNRLLTFQSIIRMPAQVAILPQQTYLGCYPDNVNTRVLSYAAETYQNTEMSAERCVSLCNGAGYSLSGLQYSYQCWCGQADALSGISSVAESRCMNACSGNSKEVCGGPSLNTVYRADPSQLPVPPSTLYTSAGTYTLLGCYSDAADSSSTGRALTGYYSYSNSRTNQQCANEVASQNFKFLATEYGVECRAGDTLASFSQSIYGCNKACSGNPKEICGGPYSMTLYKRN